MKKKEIEILAPAGSMASLKAAIAAGADAVYLGGTKFGARAFANNFTELELLEAIDYVHLYNRKIYLAVNTLLKEKELVEELYEYLYPLYEQGLDAIIVQDTGVILFIKKYFPDLPIHASTQMTITNLLGAKFLEKKGVERIVTSRELNLEEIKEIALHTNLEIESFVHGALCYSYSGQCLFSSLIGGRSGNRGQCAQPCRLPYDVNGKEASSYLLSLKDMNTIDYIPQLIESGITSFKIEGRMKKPEYVAAVTSIYRKYVDLYINKGAKSYNVEEKDHNNLLDIYNRGGFHNGYYQMQNGKEMLTFDQPNHIGVKAIRVNQVKNGILYGTALIQLNKGDIIELVHPKGNYTLGESIDKDKTVILSIGKRQQAKKNEILYRTKNMKLQNHLTNMFLDLKLKEKINGKLTLQIEKPAKLELACRDIKVTVLGAIVEKSIQHPVGEERIEKQLKKTGNSDFDFQNLELFLDDELFISLQQLNEIRRQGMEELKRAIYLSYRRETKKIRDVSSRLVSNSGNGKFQIAASVESIEQLEAIIGNQDVKRIYVNCNILKHPFDLNIIKDYIDECHQYSQEVYYAMPHIFRASAVKIFTLNYKSISMVIFDGILIRNLESYQFLKEHKYNKTIILDYNVYTFNHYSKEFWEKENVIFDTAPLELNYKELQQIDLQRSDLVIYGYLPMMISAQCLQKNLYGCNEQTGVLKLKDRYQKEFPVKNYCNYCYNIIYNNVPLDLSDQKKELLKLQPNQLRIEFTMEDAYETTQIVKKMGDIFIRNYANTKQEVDFTRGHFKRGIK